jgi:hypothetical protein
VRYGKVVLPVVEENTRLGIGRSSCVVIVIVIELCDGGKDGGIKGSLF